jgi:hypothetical protein
MFTRDEINHMGLDQLSAVELDAATEAYNGFEQLFDRGWVLAPFQGMRSPRFVRMIVNLWQDWLLLRALPNIDRLVQCWRQGINEAGVLTEVAVGARLIRGGARLDLYPLCAGRVPDFRVIAPPEEQVLYLEISKRSISEIKRRSLDVLRHVAETAGLARPGLHCKVALFDPQRCRAATAFEMVEVLTRFW